MASAEPQATSAASWWKQHRVLWYFLLGLVLVDGVLAWYAELWQSYSPDDYRERLEGCRKQPRDLVIVGGSPVSEGIDPDRFVGMTWKGRSLQSAYAMGFPGGTTSEFWHAVKHGISQPPTLLIYGISASDLNDRRHEPHGPYSLMSWGDWASWVWHRPQTAEWVTRHFIQGKLAKSWQLFRYRNALRLWAAEQVNAYWSNAFPKAHEEAVKNRNYFAELRQGNGYAPNPNFSERRYDQFKAAGGQLPQPYFWNNYRIGAHLSYLHRILDWADARGVTVVLVDMPVTADIEEIMYPKEFAQFREALAQVEQERRVLVLRASRARVGLTEADFGDWIHLNRGGARKLSDWIRQELEGRP